MAKKKLGKKLSKKLGNKIKKLGNKFGKSSLLKSSATLYVVLIISIGLVLMYLSKKDYNSLVVLIATGLLTNYFTKNMTITLGVAIIVSLIVRMEISNKGGFKEGNEEKAKEKEKAKAKNDEKNDEKGVKTDEKGVDEEKSKINEKVTEQLTAKIMNPDVCWELKDDKWSKKGDEFNNADQCPDGPEMCFSADKGDCPKKQGFSKRLIPSSEPAKVGDDEDEVDTERIDYASTLEQAYDNLQGMLGKDGIKGLTSETSKLVEQQAGLMDSLKGMGPMLKEAKTMMSGMKNMGGMETMKDMKAIINSMGGKK